jgi:glucosylceramidase
MTNTKLFVVVLFSAAVLSLNANCSKKSTSPPVTPPPPEPVPSGALISGWITKGDKSSLLQPLATTLRFGAAANSNTNVDVDSTVSYQSIDGFGYTLTGGSAMLINQLSASERTALLQELFGNGANSIGISYLRLSIGASDLSEAVFSYNDIATGTEDLNLSSFSLSRDTLHLIPVLKEILAINPTIKLMGSPWSAPVWMKTNGSSIGGSLKPAYYPVYAQYFVKYIQAMKLRGIDIDAITVQNEPQHGGNNPSMVMSATEQANFIKNNLGPAFRTAAINTKIVIWDHNCDNATYPISILDDAAAKQFIDGSAFHLYAGDISALDVVRSAHTDKNIYFTEQWTSGNGSFAGDLKWHIKNVMIGSMRNWARVALEWNLANDGGFRPHTPGGCTECQGAITLNGTVVRNVSYYIVAHLSRFVPPGSLRIQSTIPSPLSSVAFKRPDGKKVLVVLNDGSAEVMFNIRFKGSVASTSLAAGAVATYMWD